MRVTLQHRFDVSLIPKRNPAMSSVFSIQFASMQDGRERCHRGTPGSRASGSDASSKIRRIRKMAYSFRIPMILQASFAEFIGTYILVLLGNGSIAQSYLGHGEKGDFFSINWGWAIGITLGILVSGAISGGHLNPAVTLALAIKRSFQWKKLPFYWLAQYLGALAAAGTVLGIYKESFMQNKNGTFRIIDDPNDPGMAAIFANYPSFYLSTGIGLAEEIVCTAIFMLVICVVTDKHYWKVPTFVQPFYVGFALLAIGVAMGGNSGYGLNPARDLAPRLVSYLGGWGAGVFSFRDYNWFWVFIVGPHVGAVLGVCLFHILWKAHEQAIQEKAIMDDTAATDQAKGSESLYGDVPSNIRSIPDDVQRTTSLT